MPYPWHDRFGDGKWMQQPRVEQVSLPLPLTLSLSLSLSLSLTLTLTLSLTLTRVEQVAQP